ncbi:MAG: hypothetical protein LBK25_03115 [Treponema sp.]|nr:hypothetical protein [Treponema sp.]
MGGGGEKSKWRACVKARAVSDTEGVKHRGVSSRCRGRGGEWAVSGTAGVKHRGVGTRRRAGGV